MKRSTFSYNYFAWKTRLRYQRFNCWAFEWMSLPRLCTLYLFWRTLQDVNILVLYLAFQCPKRVTLDPKQSCTQAWSSGWHKVLLPSSISQDCHFLYLYRNFASISRAFNHQPSINTIGVIEPVRRMRWCIICDQATNAFRITNWNDSICLLNASASTYAP